MSDSTEQIRALLFSYAELIDAANFEGLGRLFEHATLRYAANDAVVSGRDATRRLYERANRVHSDGTLRTRHLVSNVIVDVDEAGDRAASRSYYVVFQATERIPLQPIVSGRYHDRFERHSGIWRFAERTTFVDLVGDLSDHLKIDVEL